MRVVAVMPDASGNGYWLVTNTGNVYTFGDPHSFGAAKPTSHRTLVPIVEQWISGHDAQIK